MRFLPCVAVAGLLALCVGCGTPKAARETAGMAATNLTHLTGSLAEVGQRQDRLLRFLDVQLAASATRIDNNLIEHSQALMDAAGRTNSIRLMLNLSNESEFIAEKIANLATVTSNAAEAELVRQRKDTQEALGKVQKALLKLSNKEDFGDHLKFLLDYSAKVAESYETKQKEAEKLAGAATIASTNSPAGGKK